MRGMGIRFVAAFWAGVFASVHVGAQSASSHVAPGEDLAGPRSAQYEEVQKRLATGWNTWDVHSVATQVLLPDGLAIHVGMKHNTGEFGDAFLGDALIGSFGPDAPVVTPGPHSWDGRHTDLTIEWKGHRWRIESDSAGRRIQIRVSPLGSQNPGRLPPTLIVWVDYLWNRPGVLSQKGDVIKADGPSGSVSLYCSRNMQIDHGAVNVPVGAPYFAVDLTEPVVISTEPPESRTKFVDQEISGPYLTAETAPVYHAIQTTLGWDTIYEPEKGRVISPVSRVWSVNWGGYVLFDWDTFFAATMASIGVHQGGRELAYANALETLREETPQGFVPNYARAGNWKSTDRSEPPVGAITVLGLYRKFHEKWFIEDAFEPLLKWNRWWNEHRQMQGFIVLGSDKDNDPVNPSDDARGTWQGAVFESGLDNSPMYDGTFYNKETHLLEYADVGMTSLYIADCDALAEIADALGKTAESKELRDRAERYREKLKSLWDEKAGIFLNKDLHTGKMNTRLSPTNFYPLLAKAATPEQARTMIEKHLVNPAEFGGEYVIPSIERDDPAFKDQNYWRGRIWGPMNYLVYLGLLHYDDAGVRKEFAEKSYQLFLKEWREKGHVHENYNAISGTGDDVTSSDRFYHWGALLGYVEYLEQSEGTPGK